MDAELDLQLPPEPGSVSSARRRIAEHLGGILERERLEDVTLVVSELLTNGVLHGGLSAGDRICLSLTVRDGTVRGEVRDPGPGFVPPESPGPRADMSGGWGVDGDGCTRVWFEIG